MTQKEIAEKINKFIEDNNLDKQGHGVIVLIGNENTVEFSSNIPINKTGLRIFKYWVERMSRPQ